MNTGTLKRKLEGKDFGFIAPDGGGDDVFVHKDSLVDITWDEIKQDDKVSYELAPSPKGPRAINVKKI